MKLQPVYTAGSCRRPKTSVSAATVAAPATPRRDPVRRSGLSALVAFFVLALAPASASAEAGGSAASWGGNGKWQLGRGYRTKTPNEPGPVVFKELPAGNIAQMAAGDFWSLALMSSGEVRAVGSNQFGTMGNGTRSKYATRQWIAVGKNEKLQNVTAISAAGNNALALNNEGKVMAWGDNMFGERGDGLTAKEEGATKKDEPVPVTALAHVVEIASGKGTNFARLSNGTVEAWGDNADGRLGIGTQSNEICISEGKEGKEEGEEGRKTPCSMFPRLVQSSTGILTGVERISASNDAGYALLKGKVFSWGGNRHGQLGDGTNSGPENCGSARNESPCSRVAVEVRGLSEVEAISGGNPFALALKEHKVWGWGGAGVGEIGTNYHETCVVRGTEATPCSTTPVPVEGKGTEGKPISAISAGGGFGLLLTEEGNVYALGLNAPKGQLGVGGPPPESVKEPQLIEKLPAHAVVGIVAGAQHSFAILKGGTPALSPVPKASGRAVAFGPRLTENEPAPEITVEPGWNSLLAVWTSSAPEFKIRWKRSSESTYKNSNGEWITGPCEPCSYPIESFNGAPLEYVPYDIEIGKHEANHGALIPPALKFIGVTPVTPQPPTVTSVGPSYGPYAGGTRVAITGINFDAGVTVWFGSVEAEDVTVESGQTISATAPEGAGTVDVTVENEEEDTSVSTPADRFTYAPVVSSVTPSEGSTTGGTSVTITGGNLSEASAVKLGSVNATTFTVNSDNAITATVPSETEGTVDVTVTSPRGTSALVAGDHFTYTPTVASVSPNSGSTLGGTAVTVKGAGFATGANATKFEFGSAPATAVYCGSSTECAVVAPKHETGTVDVRATVSGVMSPTGIADRFTYN